MGRVILRMALVGIGLGWASIAAAQTVDRIVVLEIRIDGPAAADHQQWAEILSEIGADRVRMVSEGFARPSVDESEFQGQTIVRVTGVLGRDGRLQLPGGTFSRRDTTELRALVTKLRKDGAQVTLAEKLAFGLTADQLVELHGMLAAEVEFPTKGERIGDVVSRLQREHTVPLLINGAARSAMASTEIVADELNGLSVGTVLAASIRPLGLVVVPHRSVGQATELQIVDSRSVEEHWPVGWPLQQTPGKTAPRLFDRINFELNRAPLMAALDAIYQKVQVPMLFDYNSLAAEGVELNEIRVNFNKKKQTYYGAIDDLLSQSRPRLKLELRVDEAQRPFLWISAGR